MEEDKEEERAIKQVGNDTGRSRRYARLTVQYLYEGRVAREHGAEALVISLHQQVWPLLQQHPDLVVGGGWRRSLSHGGSAVGETKGGW